MLALSAVAAAPLAAQTPATPAEPTSRQAAIEQEQAAKAATASPYVPNKGERLFERIDALLEGRN